MKNIKGEQIKTELHYMYIELNWAEHSLDAHDTENNKKASADDTNHCPNRTILDIYDTSAAQYA